MFAPDQPVTVPAAGNDSAIGLILVFVLLTYGGWNEAVYATAEIKDAPRLMPRILTGSLVLIAVLYLLVNFAYLRVLGLGGMAESDAVAADLMRRVFGAPSATADQRIGGRFGVDLGQRDDDYRRAQRVCGRSGFPGVVLHRALGRT